MPTGEHMNECNRSRPPKGCVSDGVRRQGRPDARAVDASCRCGARRRARFVRRPPNPPAHLAQTISTHRLNTHNRALHAGSLLVAAAGLYATYRYGRAAERKARADQKKVFVLAVSLAFKDAKQRDDWIEKWRPMVEQVGAR